MPTHSECANYSQGWCTLKHKAVNPGDPACEDFVPRSANPNPEALLEKWGDLVQRLLFIAFYRLASFVSIHAPITEIAPVCEALSETGLNGTIRWVIPERMFIWENVEMAPGIYQTLRVFGLPSGKNTTFVRIGWWRLYVLKMLGSA